ncbi:MAG: SRPBCC family protein [Candidatus Omnitrophota bacterium]
MPTITVSEIIKANKQKVYALLKDMEQFPKFMRDVKKITVLKRLPDRQTTAWEVEIDSLLVKWNQIDVFNDARCKINFQMTKGDYHAYKGCWSLSDSGRYTQISLRTELNWGLPILEKHVNRTLTKKAKLGLLGILKAIKKKAEN